MMIIRREVFFASGVLNKDMVKGVVKIHFSRIFFTSLFMIDHKLMYTFGSELYAIIYKGTKLDLT